MRMNSSFKHNAPYAPRGIRFDGFTLIEVLFALFLLTFGSVTGIAILSHSIRTFPTTRNELIAANLAQEAIEVVRNIRDAKLLAIADMLKQGATRAYPADSWAIDLKQCGSTDYRKRLELMDKNDLTKGFVIDNGCPNMANNNRPYVYLEPITGFYANLCQGGGCPDGWIDSGFRRVMYFEKRDTGGAVNATCDDTNTCAEVRVRVKVYWGAGAEPVEAACPSDTCIIAEDRLTNWVDYLESFL